MSGPSTKCDGWTDRSSLLKLSCQARGSGSAVVVWLGVMQNLDAVVGLHINTAERDPGNQPDEQRELDQADERVAEIQAAVGRLGKSVGERRAERPRDDVGEPEGEDRVPAQAPPSDRRDGE